MAAIWTEQVRVQGADDIHHNSRQMPCLPVASTGKAHYSPLMLGRADTEIHTAAGGVAAAGADAPVFEMLDGDFEQGLILVCDHATNFIPPQYGTLGLGNEQLARHIAYDIGVDGVTRRLAELLGVPAVLSNFSRLLIDPNRGLDDPTLVMRISDGALIPGNAHIDAEEIETRVRLFYRPYDSAVSGLIDGALAVGVVPALLSIHSFTPFWRGVPRPWHVGILWDRDGRMALPLLDALRSDKSLVVGDNEPYTGELEGDMMNRQGSRRGLAHALVEIRQDLIAEDAGVTEWAGRLADIMPAVVADEALHHVLDGTG